MGLVAWWAMVSSIVVPATAQMSTTRTLAVFDGHVIEDGSGGLVLWALITAFSFALMQVLSKLIISQIDPQGSTSAA